MSQNSNVTLCLDIERYRLHLSTPTTIFHSKVGDPKRMIKLTKGDTAPVLRATLLDKDNRPIYLGSRNEIKFTMREQFYFDRDSEAIEVNNIDNVSIAPQGDADNQGVFQYNWATEDTDTPGMYLAMFQILLSGIESQDVDVFVLEDGMTLDVQFDESGTTETVTFNQADFADLDTTASPVVMNATATEVVAVLNANLTGGEAFVSSYGNSVLIQTLTDGDLGAVQVEGGTSNAILNFSTLFTKNRRINLPSQGIPVKIQKNLEDD